MNEIKSVLEDALREKDENLRKSSQLKDKLFTKDQRIQELESQIKILQESNDKLTKMLDDASKDDSEKKLRSELA